MRSTELRSVVIKAATLAGTFGMLGIIAACAGTSNYECGMLPGESKIYKGSAMLWVPKSIFWFSASPNPERPTTNQYEPDPVLVTSTLALSREDDGIAFHSYQSILGQPIESTFTIPFAAIHFTRTGVDEATWIVDNGAIDPMNKANATTFTTLRFMGNRLLVDSVQRQDSQPQADSRVQPLMVFSGISSDAR